MHIYDIRYLLGTSVKLEVSFEEGLKTIRLYLVFAGEQVYVGKFNKDRLALLDTDSPIATHFIGAESLYEVYSSIDYEHRMHMKTSIHFFRSKTYYDSHGSKRRIPVVRITFTSNQFYAIAKLIKEELLT